ncbi:hypothetical protein M438DRAFT_409473 [Aureobasidium pullulans EXF-150]|uniref:Uncharacterized protein n=1 Tax=Aureobasidium pullulans EXF-150 TaxID=1043002 RepID=A0A074X2B1_AURPU|nr:uncharacterized protein M438DRAFT_409473 [Aureobasidium pullulans EXF-150]KEQ79548.1 hypothetical protein M438DRAFT_409473 [Aureobasidium pullulans EXF-150]
MSKTYSDKDTRRTKSPEFQTGKKRPHGEATSRSPAPEDPDAKRVKTEPNIKEEKIPTEPRPPRAIGGGNLQLYDGEECYSVAVHEPLQDQLTVNTEKHQQAVRHVAEIARMVSKWLDRYREEDDQLASFAEWFSNNLTAPEIKLVLFVLMGKTGQGKTSTLNSLISAKQLARAGKGVKSCTQTVNTFSHGEQSEKFLVTIFLLPKDKIRNMVQKCANDLVTHFKHVHSAADQSEDEDEEQEEDPIGSAYLKKARSAQITLRDLFLPDDDSDALEDMEDWAEKRGLLSATSVEAPAEAVDKLVEELEARAVANDFSLNTGKLIIVAESQGELDGKTRIFTDRGGFAPVVDTIETQLFNAWMNQGIKLVDRPGTSDKNEYMLDHAASVSKTCTSEVIVSELSRCLSNDDLDATLIKAIRDKGPANVCLVLTGRETMEDLSEENWKPDEKAKLKTMKDDLRALQPNTVEHKTQEDLITKHRIVVRDRIITNYFSQKRYAGIKVVTVSNSDYEKHITPGHAMGKPFLSVLETRIPELRAWMCEAPGNLQVRRFAIYLHEFIRKCARTRMWTENAVTVRRGEASKAYEEIAYMPLATYQSDLDRAADSYHSEMEHLKNSKWGGKAFQTIEGWMSINVRRVTAVLKNSGRYTPPKKKSETEIPATISFNGDLLKVAEMKIRAKENIIIQQYHKIEKQLVTDLRAKLTEVDRTLVSQDLIGGSDKKGFSSFVEREGDTCIRGIKADGLVLEKEVRILIDFCLRDESYDGTNSSAFIQAMHQLYEKAMTHWKPGSKKVPPGGISKARLRHVRENVVLRNGPYSAMSDEIRNRLKASFITWARNVQQRLDELFETIKKYLFSSFEGKRMPEEKRLVVGKIIKDRMTEALDKLEPELQPYLKHTL